MLPRSYRLRRAADIQRVRRYGQRRYHPLIRLMYLTAEQDVTRFAVVAGRQVGNAVVRNRCKRLIREALRQHLPQIPAGWDCLIAANAGMADADFTQVSAAIEQLLKKAGLWKLDSHRG